MNDKRSGRSWDEETRDEFHPAVILALIVGQFDLTPTGTQELIELTCHFLGYSREYSEAYRDGHNIIAGFYTRWLPKMHNIAEPLANLYPQLAKFGQYLRVRGYLDEGVRDERLQLEILREIERRFGYTISVLPSKTQAKAPWSAQIFSPAQKQNKPLLPPIKPTTAQTGKKIF